eukprot:jgi/Galph1/5300/GphlegSOOS_G3922.1
MQSSSTTSTTPAEKHALSIDATEVTKEVVFSSRQVQFHSGKAVPIHCKLPFISLEGELCWLNGLFLVIQADIPFLLFSPNVDLSSTATEHSMEELSQMEHVLVLPLKRTLCSIQQDNCLEFILEGGQLGPCVYFGQPNELAELLNVLTETFYFCLFREDDSSRFFIREEREWLEPLLNDFGLNEEETLDTNTTIQADNIIAKGVFEKGKKRFLVLPMEVAEKLANIARITREARDELIERLQRSHSEDTSELSLEQLQKCMWSIDKETISYASRTIENEEDLPTYFKEESESIASVSLETWHSYLDSEGRIRYPLALQYSIFRGGCSESVRKEIWPFLLQVFPWSSTLEERRQILEELTRKYNILKSQWGTIFPEQEMNYKEFRERKDLIEKDVIRTDRNVSIFQDNDSSATRDMKEILLTYSFYHFDIGYCQGMSDMLAPIMYVFYSSSEENRHVLSFWCFCGLMQRIQSHFQKDQQGMRTELTRLKQIMSAVDKELATLLESKGSDYLFCFRWIFILFKREFPWKDLFRLWDVFFVDTFARQDLPLFVTAGLLTLHRERIIHEKMEFDDLIRYIHDMSMRIDIHLALNKGRELQQRYYRRRNTKATTLAE